MKNQGIMCNKNLIEKDECGNWEVKGLPWEKLREEHVLTKEDREKLYGCLCKLKDYESTGLSPDQVERIQEKKAEGWIPCDEKMPTAETDVLILAKRKFRDGSYGYIATMAMYEDGTVSENDSCWDWQDIDGEYDEENDCYIIPEGWWESRKYNTIDALNFAVDDEVIAWKPLPEPKFIQKCANPVSQEEREELNKNIRTISIGTYQTNADRIRSMSDEELAELLDSVDNGGIRAIDVDYPCDECAQKTKCEDCFKEWLQSEVEE